MAPIKILIVCPDEPTLFSSINFLSQKGMEVSGTHEIEKSIELFSSQLFDIVIISGGVDNKKREILKREFPKINKEVEFIEHYGNPQNLLNEIQESFEDF